MKRFFRRALPVMASLLILGASSAAAQSVTLQSSNGSVRLSGELLDYDGEFYRIKTVFGEMTLNALGVTCIGLGCPDPGQYAADITISGARGAVLDLLPGLIENFGFSSGLNTVRSDQGTWGWTYFISDPARVPVARIQAVSGNSAKAFTDMVEDHVDLAVTSLPASTEQIAAARLEEVGNLAETQRQQVLAIDALVFLVSPLNPVSSLTRSEIARVYSGQITNWAQLGGVSAPIELFQRNPDSDEMRGFLKAIFPPDEPISLARATAFKSDSEISDAIAANPFAIGFTGFAGIRNAKPLAIKGACGIRLYPSSFNLRTGDYPLTSLIRMYTPARRLPVFARNFLAFAESDLAQLAIADLGFVGQQQERLHLADQQERMTNAIREAGDEVGLQSLQGFVKVFSGAERLSATFRFNDNSIQMDARSKRNITQIARMIETGDFDGRQLIFAGFSDSQGSASGNRRIARQRAEQVAKAVKDASPRADLSKLRIRSVGMGEVSPVACNDTQEGRHVNRRVEVWLK